MEPLPSELGRIAQHYDLQDIYVFGSRANEIAARVRLGATPGTFGSDVDIAVQPRRGRSLDAHERVRIAIEFENLFDAPRVDLVILSEARPSLAVDVIRGELLYTADPRAQAEHELYVLRRAADLAPLQRERERLVLERGGR